MQSRTDVVHYYILSPAPRSVIYYVSGMLLIMVGRVNVEIVTVLLLKDLVSSSVRQVSCGRQKFHQERNVG